MTDITVFRAKKIVTLSGSVPVATHVAVRDGRILGFGSAEEVATFGPATVDDRFADKVILPGFVEGHSHLQEGTAWRTPYLGFFDRRGPDGRMWKGIGGIAEAVARLQEVAATLPEEKPVVAWGFDPIYFGGRRMDRGDLDQVSTTRPVVVGHISGHIMNVNSVALAQAGFTRDTNLDGLVRDAAGEPTGELLGPDAMGRVRRMSGDADLLRRLDGPAIRDFARIAQRVGVTTAADLVSDMSPELVGVYREVTEDAAFPIRLAPALAQRMYDLEAGPARFREMHGRGNDKLYFNTVKLVTDGSIQGFTARLRWPGYHNGAPNGLWYIAPSELLTIIEAYHLAGAVIHIHTNGDEASEAAVEMIGRVLQAHPRPDHRHTLQHCQMPDEALYRRMASLGICANIFANHIWYWGEQHAAITMGPTRAARLDACATALRAGVRIAIHCDAPVTPLDPLFTAWCAVNRLTPSGRVLGPEERIPVADAIRAVTIGPAYTMKLDHLIGSIDVGKFADFAVLDDDPFAAAPAELKDVPVHATVLGGRVFMPG